VGTVLVQSTSFYMPAWTRYVHRTRVVCPVLQPSGESRVEVLDFNVHTASATTIAEKPRIVARTKILDRLRNLDVTGICDWDWRRHTASKIEIPAKTAFAGGNG